MASASEKRIGWPVSSSLTQSMPVSFDVFIGLAEIEEATDFVTASTTVAARRVIHFFRCFLFALREYRRALDLLEVVLPMKMYAEGILYTIITIFHRLRHCCDMCD